MPSADFVKNFALLLTFVTVPLELNPLLQAVKCYRAGTMGDVSLGTFAIIFSLGVMWLAYGIMIGSVPIIAGNVAKLLASSSVLILWFRFRHRNREVPKD